MNRIRVGSVMTNKTRDLHFHVLDMWVDVSVWLVMLRIIMYTTSPQPIVNLEIQGIAPSDIVCLYPDELFAQFGDWEVV